MFMLEGSSTAVCFRKIRLILEEAETIRRTITQDYMPAGKFLNKKSTTVPSWIIHILDGFHRKGNSFIRYKRK